MLKRRFSITGLPLVLLLATLTGCFSAGPAPGDAEGTSEETARCITLDEADRLADQVMQLVNLERAAVELPPVVRNETLEAIAADYACRMIEEEFFGHLDPLTGRGPGERAVAGKYAFYSVGENLAAGQRTAADVMEIWMESPPHREIILDSKWKEVGIAVRAGGEYSIYWVMEFGDPPTF